LDEVLIAPKEMLQLSEILIDTVQGGDNIPGLAVTFAALHIHGQGLGIFPGVGGYRARAGTYCRIEDAASL
jgi:hypothetical protein